MLAMAAFVAAAYCGRLCTERFSSSPWVDCRTETLVENKDDPKWTSMT